VKPVARDGDSFCQRTDHVDETKLPFVASSSNSRAPRLDRSLSSARDGGSARADVEGTA